MASKSFETIIENKTAILYIIEDCTLYPQRDVVKLEAAGERNNNEEDATQSRIC